VIETDGDTLVIVKRRVTPEQRLRLALADNRATELSAWDAERLHDLQAQAPDILAHLWTEQELREVFAHVQPTPHSGLTDPDALPDERPTSIQRGDLFALGAHRVLCGDSTNPADVTRLLDGTRPLLMVTDPPYGVDYDQRGAPALASIGVRASSAPSPTTIAPTGQTHGGSFRGTLPTCGTGA
jgi:hypothetical protein